MFRKLILMVVLLCFWLTGLEAQDKKKENKNDLSALLLHFQFGVQVPGADLNDTYGFNSLLSGGMEYRFSKSNWGILAQFDYIFGDNVEIDVLDDLRTAQGYLIGTDGLPADVFLRERGFRGYGALTYDYDLLPGRNRLGLHVAFGVGYITHWIRIQDDRQTADQIRGAYKDGYDRRRAGLSLHQFIGIQYLSHNKRVNFSAGFDFSQAWTKSIRPWDFDTKMEDSESYFDLLNGFKFGWIIPIYFNESTEYIFY